VSKSFKETVTLPVEVELGHDGKNTTALVARYTPSMYVKDKELVWLSTKVTVLRYKLLKGDLSDVTGPGAKKGWTEPGKE
jgi:hypothetical protein